MPERRTIVAAGVDAVLGALSAAAERRPRGGAVLAVVTYHRVAPAADRPDLLPGLAVDPDDFAAQVDTLVAHADPVSLDELLAAADGGAALPRRAVHVTFDDAYRCVEEHAWPVLRAAGVPATTFVPTAHPDRPLGFWWDRLHQATTAAAPGRLEVDGRRWPTATPAERATTLRALKDLVAARPHADAMALVAEVEAAASLDPPVPATSSWAGLRRLAAEGMALGVHTRTHPLLDRLDPDQLDDEVAGAYADLRREVGDAARPAIAYPGGHVSDAAVQAAERAGLRLGLTTRRGVCVGGVPPDRLRLPRINVGRRTTGPLLRAQLRPEAHRVHDLVRAAAPPHGRSDGDPTNPSPGRAPWN